MNPLATQRPQSHKPYPKASKQPAPTLPPLPYEAAIQERKLRESTASVDRRVSAKYEALVKVQQEAERLHHELMDSEGYEIIQVGSWDDCYYAVHPLFMAAFKQWHNDNPYSNHPDLEPDVTAWAVIAL